MSLWLFTIALQDVCLMMPRQSFPLMTDYEYEILIFSWHPGLFKPCSCFIKTLFLSCFFCFLCVTLPLMFSVSGVLCTFLKLVNFSGCLFSMIVPSSSWLYGIEVWFLEQMFSIRTILWQKFPWTFQALTFRQFAPVDCSFIYGFCWVSRFHWNG